MAVGEISYTFLSVKTTYNRTVLGTEICDDHSAESTAVTVTVRVIQLLKIQESIKLTVSGVRGFT